MPVPNSTGASVIENSSIRPLSRYSWIVSAPPAMAHVAVTGRLAGLEQRALDAVVDEAEGGAARPLPRVTLGVGDDEHRRVERRLPRPCQLAAVEHPLAHDARAGALVRRPCDVVVESFLAALAELEALPEPPLREQPPLQLRPLRHPALGPRVVLTFGREYVLDGHGVGRHEAVQ